MMIKSTVTRMTLLSVGLAGGLIAAPEGSANSSSSTPAVEIEAPKAEKDSQSVQAEEKKQDHAAKEEEADDDE
jgi:hypothetical protein